MPIPDPLDVDLTSTPAGTKTSVETVLQGKYNDAILWAQWAATKLEQNISDVNNLLGADVAGANLSDIQAAIDSILAYSPPEGLTYIAPDSPAYLALTSYEKPTLGALAAVPLITAVMGERVALPTITATMGNQLALPDITDIVVGEGPSTDVTFDNPDFASTLADGLTSKLNTDLSNGGTGLGATEDALFAREVARQNTARAKAYDEITSQFSARGFDMPPGALLAKQTEINNESNIRLSDASSQIMAESARLAVEWNKTTVSASTQMVEVLARIHDSKLMRAFEVSKTTVMLALEKFKETISVALANADIQKKRVDSVVAHNDGVVRTYLGEIDGEKAVLEAAVAHNDGVVKAYLGEVDGQKAAIDGVVASNTGVIEVFKAENDGQIEPMKAIASVNDSLARQYGSAIEGARANLEAQTIPEELKVKGYDLNTRIAEAKSRMAGSQAELIITTAARQLQLEVTTLQGLAQSFASMVSGALNGVSVSVTEGWSATPGSGLVPGEGTKEYTYDEKGKVTKEVYNPDLL